MLSVKKVKLAENKLFVTAVRAGACKSSVRDSGTRAKNVGKLYAVVEKLDAGKGGGTKSLSAGCPCLASTDRTDCTCTWQGGGRGLFMLRALAHIMRADDCRLRRGLSET